MIENNKLAQEIQNLDFACIKKVYLFEEEKEILEYFQKIGSLIDTETFILIKELHKLRLNPIIIDSIEEMILEEKSKSEIDIEVISLIADKRKEIELELYKINPNLRVFIDSNLLRSVKIGYIFIFFNLICDELQLSAPKILQSKIKSFSFAFDGEVHLHTFSGFRYKNQLTTKQRYDLALLSKDIALCMLQFIFQNVLSKKPDMLNA